MISSSSLNSRFGKLTLLSPNDTYPDVKATIATAIKSPEIWEIAGFSPSPNIPPKVMFVNVGDNLIRDKFLKDTVRDQQNFFYLSGKGQPNSLIPPVLLDPSFSKASESSTKGGIFSKLWAQLTRTD